MVQSAWLMFDRMFLGLFKYLKPLSDLSRPRLFKVLETERNDFPLGTSVELSGWETRRNIVVCGKFISWECCYYCIWELRGHSNKCTFKNHKLLYLDCLIILAWTFKWKACVTNWEQRKKWSSCIMWSVASILRIKSQAICAFPASILTVLFKSVFPQFNESAILNDWS